MKWVRISFFINLISKQYIIEVGCCLLFISLLLSFNTSSMLDAFTNRIIDFCLLVLLAVLNIPLSKVVRRNLKFKLNTSSTRRLKSVFEF